MAEDKVLVWRRGGSSKSLGKLEEITTLRVGAWKRHAATWFWYDLLQCIGAWSNQFAAFGAKKTKL